jgi:hypothetical protein
MQIIVVQSGLYVTAIATTIIGIHTYIYALNPIYLYGHCYVYMHSCATAKL